MLITIFTPLYNRVSYLKRIYKSLVQQNDSEIEWIIVDDGSSDNPKQIIDKIKTNAPFKILFINQKNRGKHVAINKGIKNAKGDYFFILDSDDFLPQNAIKVLREKIKLIHTDNSIAGVSGRCMIHNNAIVGNIFNADILSNALDIRYKHNVIGDLAEVFKTRVLRKFPFPVFKNEKFCPEALVWNRIAQKYKLLFFNKPIYTCEYLDGGLTDKIVKIRMTSPIASMLTYSELASYAIPVVQKIKAYINFWRFAFNSEQSLNKKLNYLKHKIGILLLPIGYLMFLNDKKKHL